MAAGHNSETRCRHIQANPAPCVLAVAGNMVGRSGRQTQLHSWAALMSKKVNERHVHEWFWSRMATEVACCSGINLFYIQF